MTAQTLTLTDFLLQRIAEDEAVARGAYRDSVDDDGVCHEDWTDATTAVMWGDLAAISGLEADYLSNHIARHDPARVLAECEAKRGLLTFVLEHGASIDGEFGCCHDAESLRAGGRGSDFDGDEFEPLPEDCDGVKAALPGLLLLALPYADHPDYNPDWRP